MRDDAGVEKPALGADEKTTLAQFLDGYRTAIVRKTEGLTDDRAKWSPVASGTSIFGLVAHLTYTERWWFAHVVGGLDVEFPWSPDDPDADWRGPDGATLADVVRGYEEECARSREILAAADLDRLCEVDDRTVSVRWVAVHMIEETARHTGHADVVREQVDGTTGW